MREEQAPAGDDDDAMDAAAPAPVSKLGLGVGASKEERDAKYKEIFPNRDKQTAFVKNLPFRCVRACVCAYVCVCVCVCVSR